MPEKSKTLKPIMEVPEVCDQFVACYFEGFRVARIVRCCWDPSIGQVVTIRIATYGGSVDSNYGYNGNEHVLERKEFTNSRGQSSFGVLVGKKDTYDIDVYVKRTLADGVVPGTAFIQENGMGRKSPKPDPALPAVVVAATPKPGRRPPPPETPEPKMSRRPPPPETPEPKAPRNPPPPDTPEGGTEAEMQPRMDRVCNECWHPNDPKNDVRVINAQTKRSNPYCPKCNQCTGLAPARPAKPVTVFEELEEGDEDFEHVTAKTEQQDDFEDAPRGPTLAPAEEFDEKKPLPKLVAIQTNAADHKLTERLAAVLATNPKLLKKSGLPGEPRWDVICPDKAVLDIGGYGPDKTSPVKATQLEVVGYTPGKKGAAGYMGSTMPATQVFKSIRLLLTEHEPEKAPTPRSKPPAKLPPLPKIETADDDFFDI